MTLPEAVLSGSVVWIHPWAFALLPLAACVAWLGLRARRVGGAMRLVHPDLHGLARAPARGAGRRLPAGLAAGAVACCVVALAQPQAPGRLQRPAPTGRDVVLLLDTTLSMTLRDLRWDGRPAERLAVAERVFARFVDASVGDRFGIIVFGARPATLLAPTWDRRLAARMLLRARANELGDGGCLGDAITLALRQVARQHRLRPVLVVVSDDGSSRGGHVSPAQATALARAMGVRVFTMQVGARQADGRAYRVPAFDASQPDLADIARLTGGSYFYAADAGAQRRAAEAIARLAPTLQAPPHRGPARQLFAWPLAAGMLLLALADALARRGPGGAGR